MYKHTPGPWKVDHPFLSIVGLRGTRPVHIADVKTRGPALPGHQIPENEGAANARLIAAAPKLLEMLERLLGELSYVHETGDVRDSIRNATEHMNEARAAIAEAKGE